MQLCHLIHFLQYLVRTHYGKLTAHLAVIQSISTSFSRDSMETCIKVKVQPRPFTLLYAFSWRSLNIMFMRIMWSFIETVTGFKANLTVYKLRTWVHNSQKYLQYIDNIRGILFLGVNNSWTRKLLKCGFFVTHAKYLIMENIFWFILRPCGYRLIPLLSGACLVVLTAHSVSQ